MRKPSTKVHIYKAVYRSITATTHGVRRNNARILTGQKYNSKTT